MIRCIVVDDEQHAIEILVHHIRQSPGLDLLGTYTNPIEALQALSEQPVDLVFLDIQMPELSGIDFIKALRGKSRVILTTAYSEFALEGYELYVVDYLLKPIRLPRFLAAVQKVLEQLGPAGPENAPETTEGDYIFVKTEAKGKLLKIELAEIDFIEGMKNYVAIHRGGKRTLVYASMKNIAERLSAKQFVRVHKSYIVPLSRISGIEGNLLRLKNGRDPILIGENYRAGLMERISGKIV